MATALVPHTQNPVEIRLNTLPADIAEKVTSLLDQANYHADHRELTASTLLHQKVIDLLDMQAASGELARCTCENCWNCDYVFDANQARTYTSLGIEFVQCPACADEHRIYSD